MSLWTTYDLPWNVSIGGGAQYMDAVFRNATNTAAVPSYWLTNALVSYKVNEHLTLRMNGQNLADKEYVDRVGGGHYIPGAGPAGDAEHRFRLLGRAMLLQIPDVLSSEQVAHARRLLDESQWVDGRVTAGHQSARTKDNSQLPEDHPVARQLGRHDPRGAAAEPAVHFGGAAASCVSAACSTATRAASRSAITSTTRYAR